MSENVSESTGPETEGADPFSPENIGTVQLIVQMRTYDVLMALLTHFDAARARDLLELHTGGVIVGPSPRMSGDFVTDQINDDDDSIGSD